MTKNDIKKALYKQKPKAILRGKKQGFWHYECDIKLDIGVLTIDFLIPNNEYNESFVDEIDAQLLIRWLNEN